MSDSYPVFLIEETRNSYLYFFETDASLKYFINFTKATHYFNDVCTSCQNIFEVSFFPERNERVGLDRKVKPTILKLIETFIIKNECPVLYICDSLDSKEKCRMRLFEKWFTESDYQQDFKHDSRILEFTDYTVILGIIAYSWDADFETYFEQIDNNVFD